MAYITSFGPTVIWFGPVCTCCVQLAAAPRRTPLRVVALRVNNVEIPNSKRIEFSLQYIFGIGSTTAQKILVDAVSANVAWDDKHHT